MHTAAPLPADPDRKLSPEEIERHWFENVYQGDRMRQLTIRAVIMGMALGMIMVCSNVYVGLKSGWSMGVAITSCVMAYVIFSVFQSISDKLFPGKFPPFTILENNAMQSCASAAGMMSGAGLVNAIPALLMLDPSALPVSFHDRCMWLIPWVALISMLGVFLAVPTKRQMINIEQLPFPSGIAAATTLRTLHGEGGEAMKQARALGFAGLIGGLTTWLRDAADISLYFNTTAIPGAPNWSLIKEMVTVKALPWLQWPKLEAAWGTQGIRLGTWKDAPLYLNQVTMSLEGSLLFVAAGAIMSFRQAWSLLLGAVINYCFLAPWILDRGIIDTASFGKISRWSLWTGVPMMVTSGLLIFFLNWRSVARAFSNITAFFKPAGSAADDPMEKIEVPGSWFIAGYVFFGTAVILLGHALFHIAYWMGLVAVLATFLLVVVAARATGETDVTPTGPVSKLTQLTFGALKPGDVGVNLMTANITAGAVTHAGDLLTDLKSGYLLGANPRQQFLAQFFGVIAGSLVVVPVFFILIPDVNMLGTDKWPAPAALVWRGVAELLSKGPEALHPTARWGLLIGASVGILLPVLEMIFPKKKAWIPSATGLGLAFTINGFNSVSMFFGAAIALYLSKRVPALHEKYTVPVSSGIIAGESLMGVAIAFMAIKAG